MATVCQDCSHKISLPRRSHWKRLLIQILTLQCYLPSSIDKNSSSRKKAKRKKRKRTLQLCLPASHALQNVFKLEASFTKARSWSELPNMPVSASMCSPCIRARSSRQCVSRRSLGGIAAHRAPGIRRLARSHLPCALCR